MLTPDKLLTWVSVLLAQINVGNNSYKLKTESDKKCICFIHTIKSPKKFTTI